MKYAIEHRMFAGWDNTWTDDNERPITFDTIEQAEKELDFYLFTLGIETDLGNIEGYSPEDFRIKEITE